MSDDRYSGFDYRRLINWDARLEREWPFFESVFANAPSKQILDLGSGTGDHARFLTAKGLDVTGIDTSPAMLEKARAATEGDMPRFIAGDIREISAAVSGEFGGAICVGNVLPHLKDEDDLRRLAGSVRRALMPGAPFVLQMINYDRIEAKKERALPLSFLPEKETGATIVFIRTMELLPDGRVIFMPTSLRQQIDKDPPLEMVTSHRVEIRGWRRPQVESAFRAAGFTSIETFGSYEREPFEAGESRDLILVAR